MHTIRLRGPWQLEPVERFVRGRDGRLERTSESLPPAARATMPADWSNDFGRDFCGRVRYQRIFQKPTGLETGERVWLVIDPPRSYGVVTLNDEPLGEIRVGDPPARFDITDRLADHNRLEIVVTHPVLDAAGRVNEDSSDRAPGGLIGLVRLEIEE
jgi:beta-galactosidase/beta-glucuronidase